MKKVHVTWDEVFDKLRPIDKVNTVVYGVPKGGMIVSGFLKNACITHDPYRATMILDDLVDSGRTRDLYLSKFPKTPFVTLFDKKQLDNSWIVFPWEQEHPSGPDSIQDNIVRQLEYIGENPRREGLVETPDRIVRSWEELFSGYSKDPKEVFKVFSSDGYNQIILLKDIELFSMCEHHWLPFFGTAHVAYIPDKKIVGISKLARLIEVFSRRLQIQERLGDQVTEALMNYLTPIGAACVIEAVHMCMRMRGVSKQHSTMITSSLKGIFLSSDSKGVAARNELMGLIK